MSQGFASIPSERIDFLVADFTDADEEEDEPDEEDISSVVPPKYKVLYKELGHPGRCGDELSDELKEYNTVDDIIGLEAFCVGLDLIEPGQYSHLNNGMRRMNCGNRLRGLIRNTPRDEIAFTLPVGLGGAALKGEGPTEACLLYTSPSPRDS